MCAPFYVDQLLPGHGPEASAPDVHSDVLADRWRGVYGVDIMDGVAPSEAANVLGGQISAWGEAMSDANAHELIWKVGGAAAEALWSPRSRLTLSDLGDSAEGLATEQRLSQWLCHLRGLGIAVGPILPPYCQVIRHQLVVSPPGDDGCVDNPRNSEPQPTDKWSGLAVLGGCVLSFAVGWFTSVACSTRKHAARTSLHQDDDS